MPSRWSTRSGSSCGVRRRPRSRRPRPTSTEGLRWRPPRWTPRQARRRTRTSSPRSRPCRRRRFAARWHGMQTELTRRVEEARQERGEVPGVLRARERAVPTCRGSRRIAGAREVDGGRASGTSVDHLETHGRTLPRDPWPRHRHDSRADRSRERAHLDAIASRRDGIDLDATSCEQADAVGHDVLVWEQAALEGRGQRAPPARWSRISDIRSRRCNDGSPPRTSSWTWSWQRPPACWRGPSRRFAARPASLTRWPWRKRDARSEAVGDERQL